MYYPHTLGTWQSLPKRVIALSQRRPLRKLWRLKPWQAALLIAGLLCVSPLWADDRLAYEERADNTPAAHESSDKNSNASMAVSLAVTPQSCLSESATQACTDHVTLRWHVPGAQMFCIWRAGDEQPLFCPSETSGERRFNLSINETLQFLLLDRDSKAQLASAELVVLATAERHYRRRYQHPWSVF